MRRALCGVALCVALSCSLAAPSWGAKVKGDRSYRPYEKIVLVADDVEKGSQILWDVDGDVQTEEKDNVLHVWAKPGTYRVTMTAINFDSKKVTRAKYTFTVQPDVAPTPPTPPDPPKPPAPPPSPAPIPAEGFRVLIVYETGQTLPKDQAVILNSGAVRDYLRAKCVKDPDAEQDGKAYRIWDKDTDLANVNKTWADAMKRERKSVPWIIVSNHPKGGYEGPLPESVEKTLELLKKYGE